VEVTQIICSHREHRIYGLEGAMKLICKQAHCSNNECSSHSTLINPESELTITMPRWRIDWNLFTWIGFRRFKRHWSVPQIHEELFDSYQVSISENTIDFIFEKVSGYGSGLVSRFRANARSI